MSQSQFEVSNDWSVIRSSTTLPKLANDAVLLGLDVTVIQNVILNIAILVPYRLRRMNVVSLPIKMCFCCSALTGAQFVNVPTVSLCL